MALFSRLRTGVILNSLNLRNLATSSILSAGENAAVPSTSKSKDKTRAVITLLKSESNPERILDICRSSSFNPGSHLDRIALAVAVSKLSEANHTNGISQFLEELKTRSDLYKNESVIIRSIVLYGRANMTEHAVRTFTEMDKQGLPHSINAFNALLFAFILAEDYKEVKRIFNEFQKTYGIEPNLDTYNRVIKSLCKSGDSSAVNSILSEMDRKSIKPNATSFGLWLAGCYREEKFGDVGKVLQMMETHRIKAGVTIYNVRIMGLCKLKKSKEAKALLDQMLSSGIKPNSVSYCHLIRGFCKEGNFEEANRMFVSMISRGLKPDSQCYLDFLCQGGDYETALKVCRVSMDNGWVPFLSTMKPLVRGLAGVYKVAEAKELLGLVKLKFPENTDMWNQIEEGLPH